MAVQTFSKPHSTLVYGFRTGHQVLELAPKESGESFTFQKHSSCSGVGSGARDAFPSSKVHVFQNQKSRDRNSERRPPRWLSHPEIWNSVSDAALQNVHQRLLQENPAFHISRHESPLFSDGQYLTMAAWVDNTFMVADSISNAQKQIWIHPSELADCGFSCKDDSLLLLANEPAQRQWKNEHNTSFLLDITLHKYDELLPKFKWVDSIEELGVASDATGHAKTAIESRIPKLDTFWCRHAQGYTNRRIHLRRRLYQFNLRGAGSWCDACATDLACLDRRGKHFCSKMLAARKRPEPSFVQYL